MHNMLTTVIKLKIKDRVSCVTASFKDLFSSGYQSQSSIKLLILERGSKRPDILAVEEAENTQKRQKHYGKYRILKKNINF